jgi:hypothetical protein
VLHRNFRYFNFFSADSKRRNCPSARCPKATIGIGSDVDIFNGRSISVSDWLVPDYNTVLGHYIRFKEFYSSTE